MIVRRIKYAMLVLLTSLLLHISLKAACSAVPALREWLTMITVAAMYALEGAGFEGPILVAMLIFMWWFCYIAVAVLLVFFVSRFVMRRSVTV